MLVSPHLAQARLRAMSESRPPVVLSGDASCPRLRGWLHLAALVVAVPTATLLLSRSHSRAAVASLGVYAVGLVGLYAVSSGYHLVRWSAGWRARMRRLDHAMIYLFIGACYAPICLLVIGGWYGVVLLALGCTTALAGAIMTLSRFAQTRWAAGGYLVVGWLVLGFPRVLSRLGATELALLAAGGLAYTFGSVVLALRRPDPSPRFFGYHEVWHALVIAGSACHYVLFWRLVSR
jgi:hemolysin III